jgi:hypothetical protein
MRRIAALVAVWAGSAAAVASAAPPAAGGLEALPGSPCLGSTLLATGCPSANPALQAIAGIAISPDGRTLYAATTYGNGSVVAIRRSPTGALGPVLNCISANPTTACGASSGSSLITPDGITVSAQGRVYVISGNGNSGSVTAFSTASDGSLGAKLDCASSPGLAPTTGCTSAPGMGIAQGVAITSGGTLYIASFLDYTRGSVVALPTLSDGSLGSEINCVETTGYAGGTCLTDTTAIESATNVVVGPQGIYVTSSDYQADYGEVTGFATDPGGAIGLPLGCVGDTASTCGTKAPGLAGARGLAISSDARLYVAASPTPFGTTGPHGAIGTLTAFPLQSTGGIGAELNCLGSSVATGCTPAAGLLGADTILVTADGDIYVASAYSTTDGAVAAFSRQANGAIANEINCVGVTSATGCGAFSPGLEDPVAIAGSPDPNTEDIYIGSQFAALGTDGAVAEFTRELAPVCTGHAVAATAGQPVTVPLGCSDPNLDPLTLSVAGGPAHGTLGAIDQASGTVVYTPAAGYHGPDSFTVQATDGTLTSAAGTVTVTVSPASSRAPVLTGLALRPSSFRAASSGASVARKKRSTGTTVSYKDTLGSTTTFTISQTRPGVRSGKRCVKPPRTHKRGAKPCMRKVAVGSFHHSDKAGTNSFHFSGRAKGRALIPGAYALTATPRAGGTTGKAVTRRFHIIH